MVWYGVLLGLGLLPHVPKMLDDLHDLHVDKIAHAGAYAVWGLLLFRAVRVRASFLVIAIALAFFQEFSQRFVGTRSFEWGDWFADVLGIGAGVVLARILNREGSSG